MTRWWLVATLGCMGGQAPTPLAPTPLTVASRAEAPPKTPPAAVASRVETPPGTSPETSPSTERAGAEPGDRSPAIRPAPAPGESARAGAAGSEAVARAPGMGAEAATDEVWLKGSTHVHARPSGDSREPIERVVRWYESRGYDFIALTDHNRVTEVEAATPGAVAVRAPARGLIVLAGVELTHNPVGCQPQRHPSGNCRIHVNALGVTGRPEGKIEWAERSSRQRIDMYQAALDAAARLGGGLAQINHPSWFWGAYPELLVEVARRGARLLEISNVQFATWNRGDAEHPSIEEVWDAALGQGATLWGVASDDAHHYEEGGGGRYPAGGGWVVVRARRDARAILDALARGRFYASTGVTLARAEVVDGALTVEVVPAGTASPTIRFVENGAVVATVIGLVGSHPVPARGYVRAVVEAGDGTRAWVQPARR